MARGRPALATVLMTTGVIALAVPGSTAFAGEFAILAGVFQHGWVYAVVGAVAIVLAAMYMLRLISAVLHQAPGRRSRTRRSTCGPRSWRSSCRSSRSCSPSRPGRRRSPSARSARLPQIPHKGSVVPSSAAAQLQFALKELEQKRKQQGQ